MGCPASAGLNKNLLQWYDTINKIKVTGYIISLIFLSVATFIFFYFRYVHICRCSEFTCEVASTLADDGNDRTTVVFVCARTV